MTTRGRTVAALAVSMLVLGRIAGLREMVMTGAAFAVYLVIGGTLVWFRGGRLRVRRSVTPARTTVGGSARVELTVDADGSFGFGPILMSEEIPPELGPRPRLALPGGGARRRRGVAYTITPRMRGRHRIGPLEVIHTDPFGTIRRSQSVSTASTLLVYPAFEEISVLPTAVQRIGIVRHSPLVGVGDEFYALRNYEEGDDPRKIHWPSSLRAGELMIRQEELLAEPRALFVLDTTASKHRGTGPESSLEAAVSACASLSVLAISRRMRIEVLTNDGPLLRSATPSRHELLEALALVKPSKRNLAKVIERAERPRAGRPALVVFVTPNPRNDEVRAIALRSRNGAAGAVVWVDSLSFDASKPGTRGTGPLSRRPRTALPFPVVALRRGASFRSVWHEVVKDVAMAR